MSKKKETVENIAYYFSVKDKRLNVVVNKELYEKVKGKIEKDKRYGSISDLITACFVKYLED